MKKSSIALLLGVLLVAAGGASAQDEACDPETSGTQLVDLADAIGTLACRVPPDVNLTDVMGKLTNTLAGLSPEELKKLPGVMEIAVSVPPSSLEPFFSLSAQQLTTLLPMMTGVSADKLKVVFPLLAKQPEGTLEKMVRFLKGISRSQLEKLSPMFSRITQGQINVVVHSLNVLPRQAWDILTHMMQQLGPVTDVVVQDQTNKGLISGSGSGSGSGSSNPSAPPAGSAKSASVAVGANPSAPKLEQAPAPAPGNGYMTFGVFPLITHPKVVMGTGRRMLQLSDEDTAAAALAAAAAANMASEGSDSGSGSASSSGACDASIAGIDIGIALVGPFGVVVCKFGADELRPVLNQIVEIMNKQPAEVLANLPRFTDLLTSMEPAAFSAFFKIPQSTLAALVPLVSTLDPATVGGALKTLGSQDAATIDKMVYFMNATPTSQVELLVPMFARLTNDQIDTMAKFMNVLSPGQITLLIHMLNIFGPSITAIGNAIPPNASSPGVINIGPLRVTLGHPLG